MKFTDGKWLLKEGITIQSPLEVHDVEIENNMVTIYAPGRHIRHRGDTLDGALFRITLSSPLPNVIRVQFQHFAGGDARGPFSRSGKGRRRRSRSTKPRRRFISGAGR